LIQRIAKTANRTWSSFAAGFAEHHATGDDSPSYRWSLLWFRWALTAAYVVISLVIAPNQAIGWVVATIAFLVVYHLGHTVHTVVHLRRGRPVTWFWEAIPFADVAAVSLIMASLPSLVYPVWSAYLLVIFGASVSRRGSYVLTLTVASVTGYFAAATAHEVAGSTVSWSNAAVVSVMLCFGGWFATTRAALERAIFEDLRNSETRLRVMVEQMPAVLWTTDCDLRYTLSLGAGLAALGLEPNQAVGSTLFEYFQTADADFPPIAAHKRALQGDPVSYAAEWMGTAFHCHVEPLRDSRGAIIGVIGTAQDISDLQRSAQALQESEERYRRLVESSPEPIGVHRDGKIVYANAAAARLLGAAQAADLIGTPVLDLVHPEDRERVVERIRAMQQEGTPADLAEERLVRLDGQSVDVEVLAIPISYEGKSAALTVIRDITDRKRAELLQAGQRRALEMVARGTPLEEVLDSLVRMIEEQSPGLSCSICMLSSDGSRLIPAAAPNVPTDFALALAEGVPVGPRSGSCGTAAHLRAAVVSGDIATDPLWVDYRELALRSHIEACWSLPILSGAGDVLGTFAMYYSTPRIPSAAEQRMVEIAAHIAGLAIERARAEETISHLAYHDHLTGLPNRALFHDRLTVALAQARRQKRTAAVLFLDLDEFKTVNDTAGHVLGDGLLQKVAERLTGVIRDGDTAARMGGDEFAVLVPEVSSVDEVAHVAERVLEAFRRPWVLGGQEFHVTTSVGIAMYPTDSSDAESLLRNADDAMYEAKDQGKNRYNLYTAALSVRIAERLALESSLRRGLERGEFVVYYQPQVNIESGRVVGLEALVRWQHPDLGLVLPAEFIPVAEETGLIVQLGAWVLNTACAQTRAWHEAGFSSLRVAVNLSPRQFQQRDLLDTVGEALGETGLDPHHLQLEITEGIAMDDAEFSVAALQRLVEMGVQVAIDDFGTGHSSLSYLKRFPIQAVKIDQSFVQGLMTDANDGAIAGAIIDVAHNLGLTVIAEGVETPEQLDFLRQRRCDEMQGYLYSKPLPAGEIGKVLRRDSRMLAHAPER